MKVTTICKKCGKSTEVDTSVVLTSIPPQYRVKCEHCGEQYSCFTSEATYVLSKDEVKNGGVNYIGNLGKGSNYYQECKHYIDVKAVSGGYVTYCVKCGKIFDTKDCQFNGQWTCSNN